LEKNEKMLIE